mgnify:CR=1 FL=1
MALKLENLQITDLKLKKTPELTKILDLMHKHGIPNALDLLPKSTKTITRMIR